MERKKGRKGEVAKLNTMMIKRMKKKKTMKNTITATMMTM